MTLEEDSAEVSCCGRCCGSKCSLALPQTKRPQSPVSDNQYELLQWFPFYFDATWPIKKFPVLNWLLKYRLRWLVSDLVAGLTVGLMVVPQGLAYASIANLPHAVCFCYLVYLVELLALWYIMCLRECYLRK